MNGHPAVARFTAKNYAKAKEFVATKGLHLMDALSEVGVQRSGHDARIVRKERTQWRTIDIDRDRWSRDAAHRFRYEPLMNNEG